MLLAGFPSNQYRNKHLPLSLDHQPLGSHSLAVASRKRRDYQSLILRNLLQGHCLRPYRWHTEPRVPAQGTSLARPSVRWRAHPSVCTKAPRLEEARIFPTLESLF